MFCLCAYTKFVTLSIDLSSPCPFAVAMIISDAIIANRFGSMSSRNGSNSMCILNWSVFSMGTMDRLTVIFGGMTMSCLSGFMMIGMFLL